MIQNTPEDIQAATRVDIRNTIAQIHNLQTTVIPKAIEELKVKLQTPETVEAFLEHEYNEIKEIVFGKPEPETPVITMDETNIVDAPPAP